MKLDQIAYYSRNDSGDAAVCAMLGILPPQPSGSPHGAWVEDTVEGTLRVVRARRRGIDVEVYETKSRALLRFNYSLGIEVELLRYLDGIHWHTGRYEFEASGEPFLSHLGFHLDEGEPFPDPAAFPGGLVQEFVTESHTNDYVLRNNRRYHYRIFEGPNELYHKFIRRITPETQVEWALTLDGSSP